MTGLLMALGVTQALESPGIMGLRSINPYVTAALGDWAAKSEAVSSSRQGRPAASIFSNSALAGKSDWGLHGAPKALCTQYKIFSKFSERDLICKCSLRHKIAAFKRL